MGWFLLKRFVDLFRVVCYIISRNHSKVKKTLSKVKHCSKGYLFWCQTWNSNFSWGKSNLKKNKLHQENWLGKEFVLMNLSKYKRWRAILLRVIAKQQSKGEQTHLVCLHKVEKYEIRESVNRQNIHETRSRKWTDKKKTDLFFAFGKYAQIPRRQVQDDPPTFILEEELIQY